MIHETIANWVQIISPEIRIYRKNDVSNGQKYPALSVLYSRIIEENSHENFESYCTPGRPRINYKRNASRAAVIIYWCKNNKIDSWRKVDTFTSGAVSAEVANISL